MGPAAKGRSRASKEGKVRIFTNARKVLIDKNPATFDVDPNAYDTSDLMWDGSFDDPTNSSPGIETDLYQYCAESGYVIGDGKLLGQCHLYFDQTTNRWTLTICAVSDIEPLVWEGTKDPQTDLYPTSAKGIYTRAAGSTGGTDQTSTLEIDNW